MSLHVVKGSDPAAGRVVHLFVFGKSQQLLELVFRADCGKSHCAQSACPPDSLVSFHWRLGWRDVCNFALSKVLGEHHAPRGFILLVLVVFNLFS